LVLTLWFQGKGAFVIWFAISNIAILLGFVVILSIDANMGLFRRVRLLALQKKYKMVLLLQGQRRRT
jgi:hypothetical protein